MLLFFPYLELPAQIKLDLKVSDKHLQKVEKSKDAREKLKSYKKYYTKDSLKASKKAWKTYKKQNKDSLKAEGIWEEAKENQKKILEGKWDTYKKQIPTYELDSANWPEPKDSLDWALRELALQGEYQQIQKYYEAYGQYDSTYLDQFKLDSIKIDTTQLINRFQIKERLQSYLPDELAQETDLDIAGQMKAGAIGQFGQIQKIDRSGVQDFFKNVDPEQFAKSQLSLKAAKEKYAKLPNLENEEEGVKRQSLEGTPWKKRIFLGGHFTAQSTDPLIIDSDIRAGYKFNKKFSVGAGLILREQFSNRTSTLTGDAHGYSLFTSYDLVSNLFVYGEYQAVKNKSLFHESDVPAVWENAHLLGAGRTFQFSKKLSASLTLLYDLNYKKNNLNARPLVVRLGYKIEF